MTAPHTVRERELRALRDEVHAAKSDALIKAADLDALIETIDYERARADTAEREVAAVPPAIVEHRWLSLGVGDE